MKPQRMIVDAGIALRDRILNRITGVQPEMALNAAPRLSPPPDGFAAPLADSDPAAVLRRSMNTIRALAVDERGRQVDYARLRTGHEYAAYRAAAATLRDFDPAQLGTPAERLAFWINLYNALIIDAIITFDARGSVTKTPGGALAFFNRAAYIVAGQRLSADDIEHGILRANRGHPYIPGPRFAPRDPRRTWVLQRIDPRLHFALNCASASCPPINVYAPERIDQQLDLATRGFVQSEVSVAPDGSLALSPIFRWYQDDFGGRQGMLAFLRQYLPEGEPRERLECESGRIRLRYTRYDWSLNAAGTL
jgi:hypothetical protein